MHRKITTLTAALLVLFSAAVVAKAPDKQETLRYIKHMLEKYGRFTYKGAPYDTVTVIKVSDKYTGFPNSRWLQLAVTRHYNQHYVKGLPLYRPKGHSREIQISRYQENFAIVFKELESVRVDVSHPYPNIIFTCKNGLKCISMSTAHYPWYRRRVVAYLGHKKRKDYTIVLQRNKHHQAKQIMRAIIHLAKLYGVKLSARAVNPVNEDRF